MTEDAPVSVNPQGTMFWHALELTEYATELHLQDTAVYRARNAAGEEEYVVVQCGRYVYASPLFEGVACWLDACAMSEGETG